MNHTQQLLNDKSLSYKGGDLPFFNLASHTKAFASRPDWQSSRLTKRGFFQVGLDL